ncbi:MAG: hypothetical protein HEQ23_01505 [Tepidisphaera sp.]
MNFARPSRLRRGVTLIEAVAVVLVLAISVPPTVMGMVESVNRRADAIQLIRVTTLASSVLNQIQSDSLTADIGSDVPAYLDDATTGLRSRLSPVSSVLVVGGISYDVQISGKVSSSLTASGTASLDVFRTVTVTITYVDAWGVTRSVPFTTVIAAP